jgi:N-methylhydantoinase B
MNNNIGPNGNRAFDAILLAVLSKRLDTICWEMTNTLLRAGRSAVLASARDFSCSIVTGDNQLLTAAEGAPVHVLGSHFLTQSMCELHDDLAEGDAFIHNDPYLGNTHHADHTVIVPVFVDGQHLFTACAKAHQADCGNSMPTTYMPFARDIYEEGALNFPCVRIQRNYRDVQDIIRMCRRRIRVPEQWYGDYLAMLGAARIAERSLKMLVAKYGIELIREFIREWFDYSERRMINAIRQLPDAELENTAAHDPFPAVPDGIPIKIKLKVDAREGRIVVDLRDNIDCVDAGLNQSRACAMSNAVIGVFNSLDATIPHNAGCFRRITVLLRENCVVGIPTFPASCSVATTNVGDRLVNATQAAFGKIGDGFGIAEGGLGMGPGNAVISGSDWRRGGAPYVNQFFISNNGGPGTPRSDGWVTYGLPVAGGASYRDSIEIDEQKYPIRFHSVRLQPDSGGAGRFRGAPAGISVFGPKHDPMTVIYPLDGSINPPKGIHRGHNGQPPYAAKIDREGSVTRLPSVSAETIAPGEFIVGSDCGGGGYGDPLEREPDRVLLDVLEKYVSLEKARDSYGVILTGRADDESLTVDQEATVRQRRKLLASGR